MNLKDGPNGWAGLLKSVGIGGVIALGLLGFIPGVPSPFTDIRTEIRAMADTIRWHNMETRKQLSVSRLICRGMWRGNDEMQRECDQAANPRIDPRETP